MTSSKTVTDLEKFLSNNANIHQFKLYFNTIDATVLKYINGRNIVDPHIIITLNNGNFRIVGTSSEYLMDICTDIFGYGKKQKTNMSYLYDVLLNKKIPIFTHVVTVKQALLTVGQMFDNIVSSGKSRFRTNARGDDIVIGKHVINWRNTDHQFRSDTREIYSIDNVKSTIHLDEFENTSTEKLKQTVKGSNNAHDICIRQLATIYAEINKGKVDDVYNSIFETTSVNTFSFI